MPGPYPVEAAANTILQRCEIRRIDVDPMKLQKLIYMAHGYYLAATNEPLVDEDFKAWPYGPVSTTIYHEFKRFGSGRIRSGARADRVDVDFLDDEGDNIIVDQPYLPAEDVLASDIVDYVLDTYGSRSAIYLSDLTHKIGSPWDTTRSAKPNQRDAAIENGLIQQYFQSLV